MEPLHLIDVNNQFRVYFETDNTGLPLRNAFDRAFFQEANELYICDGFKSRAMRQAIFPGYKVGRPRAPDNYYLQFNFYKELLMHSGKPVIEIAGWEADDLIAAITRAHNGPVVIHSTDRDFCALVNENVTVPSAAIKDVAIPDIPLWKTLVGDDSDKIKGIPGFGKKSFADLDITHKVAWSEAFRTRTLEKYPAQALGLSKPSWQTWFAQNISLLQAYWDVVGFFPIELDEIWKHMKVGTKDYKAADKKLKDSLQ